MCCEFASYTAITAVTTSPTVKDSMSTGAGGVAKAVGVKKHKKTVRKNKPFSQFLTVFISTHP
jgi:hypothetical protein